MYDPLGNTFQQPQSVPSWPATPHNPFAEGAILPKPSSPKPPSTPEKPPAGQYGREPQVYGQPGPGMVSPSNNGNGKYDKAEPYLRVKITGLDRNRRDILIRLDAQTNLPNFTGPTYRNVSRSYAEFQRFAEQITYSNPQTIVPALPLPQTSAATDEEDDRLVKVSLQRWFNRVSEDPFLIRDEETRSFIESDFGYQPTVRSKRKASSGFSLLKRGAPDEDEQLVTARLELTRLEGEFFDAAKAVDKLARARKALSSAHTEMGNRLINVATAEAHPPLANAFRRFGRTWHNLGDLDQAQASSETVILGDSLGYQGLNAKSAKETLQQRAQVLEEYQTAVKTSISRRRNIERLKASSNIRPERVDEALEELDEARKFEEILAKRVDGISQNLHKALHKHSRQTHEDVMHGLVEHAKAVIIYEKQLLRELEGLRTDFSNVNKRAADIKVSPAVGVTRTNSAPDLARQTTVNGSAVTAPGPSRLDGTQSMFVTPQATPTPLPNDPSRPPVSPSFVAQRAAFGASPAPPSTPTPSAMPAGYSHDPLGAAGAGSRRPEDGIQAKPGQPAHHINTLGRSMYVQPTRSRLDAREAAAKLANFL